MNIILALSTMGGRLEPIGVSVVLLGQKIQLIVIVADFEVVAGHVSASDHADVGCAVAGTEFHILRRSISLVVSLCSSALVLTIHHFRSWRHFRRLLGNLRFAINVLRTLGALLLFDIVCFYVWWFVLLGRANNLVHRIYLRLK